MARRIAMLIVADGVQVVPAPFVDAFEFSADQRQNFVKLFGRRDARQDQDFLPRADGSCLQQEAEGKLRRNAEPFLSVAAAARELQFHMLGHSGAAGYERQINRTVQDGAPGRAKLAGRGWA